ncbi:MAG: hypothetical protein IPP88_22170 [Betaproteobacteria bacterium]|nr:hypothetical protein [Betaproteobacteria bacterium]
MIKPILSQRVGAFAAHSFCAAIALSIFGELKKKPKPFYSRMRFPANSQKNIGGGMAIRILLICLMVSLSSWAFPASAKNFRWASKAMRPPRIRMDRMKALPNRSMRWFMSG